MPSATPFTVLIADDHPLFRDGVARRVEEHPELRLVAEASDGQEALRLIDEVRPDVAVLDLRMPRLDGIRACKHASTTAPETKLMILSAYVKSDLVFRAISAGACSFMSKYSSRDELVGAIVAVGRGDTVIPDTLHAGLAAEIRERGRESQPSLSLREFEVLRWIAAGATAPEIGRKLHLSAGTVKTHMQHLYEKLGVSDRAAAVAVAMRQGILE